MISDNLLVLEYSGTARSGKGTIVSHLAEAYDGVAQEETGADYRAVTWSLLGDGTIETDMPAAHIERKLDKLGASALTDIVANRNQLVAEIGLPSLHSPDVTSTVGNVSPHSAVRKAVKAGFKKRVEAVRDSGEFLYLAVDGRNLAPVVRDIRGTQLLMRTFVSSLESEAAIRECYRKNLVPGTEEWHVAFKVAHDTTLERNKLDAERTTDPVRPDEDAIDFWWDNEVMCVSARKASMLRGGHLKDDRDDAVEFMDWLTEKPHHMEQPRYGVGSIACRDGRQIKFNTDVYRGHFDDDPRGAMLAAARVMFEEAIGMHPLTDMLTRRSSTAELWFDYDRERAYR